MWGALSKEEFATPREGSSPPPSTSIPLVSIHGKDCVTSNWAKTTWTPRDPLYALLHWSFSHTGRAFQQPYGEVHKAMNWVFCPHPALTWRPCVSFLGNSLQPQSSLQMTVVLADTLTVTSWEIMNQECSRSTETVIL